MTFDSDTSTDREMNLKAIILVGGRGKGTRFQPLSVEFPKPVFPIAGRALVYHHIEACAKLPGMKEIILMGFYQPNEHINHLLYEAQQQFHLPIRYLQEFAPLGTAGGLYHFRDQIMSSSPSCFFVMNADVCSEFPLEEMLQFHREVGECEHFTIMTTEAAKEQSMKFGCMVEDKKTHEIKHYVEKPSTYVSTSINCGIYLFTPKIFKFIRVAFLRNQDDALGDHSNHRYRESIHLEKEILHPLAGTGQLFAFHTDSFWSQVKTPGAAVYANRHMLKILSHRHPERMSRSLTGSPKIMDDVYIHSTAEVHPSAVIGPNVSVGRHVSIGAGVRLRDCIVLNDVTIRDHACVINAVVGWQAVIGKWCRVEGIPCDPNPNKPFAKLRSLPVFNCKGQLNPTICIIGANVEIESEIMVRNCIVMPHKEVLCDYANEIIL